MKKACVLRWGAWGDHIMVTPLLRALKEDGYHVTVNTTKRGFDVYKNNPNVDELVEYVDDTVPNDDLGKYWEEVGKGYDKFINLSESIEGTLLKTKAKKGYFDHAAARHAECNVNYYDRTMELGGYPDSKGHNGELYLTPVEEQFGRDFRKKYKNKFVVLWSLSGSSFHKTYPFVEHTARAFLGTHPDAVIMTVGDELCQVLEWSHERTKCYSGKWPMRKSMIMTKFVDLVVGTETGILNAAGCFDTPKIVMLSHSSHENLSKHWNNAYPLHADVDCYPCHKLHYGLDSCELVPSLRSPVCMGKLEAGKVFTAMNKVYNKRREDGTFHRAR